ncbi:hypothetical protein Y032_0004g2197 [Ancylostoma ceylanicum]|uniref:Uncharacterized protein n=1 Tax=Ancylostoma ceylanicum TaxID=53326 RepID=A0A016VXN3_9BILA|nr:hypothetical protein Y032_0004g2197 [Ancylostoma ceylanicum]
MPPASHCIGDIRIQRLYDAQMKSNAWRIPRDGIDQRRPLYFFPTNGLFTFANTYETLFWEPSYGYSSTLSHLINQKLP